jgi:hypothetical protein
LDANRFDTLVASAADVGSSRRSLLARLAGGALAAVLTTLGIGGFSAEDAEARKKGGGRRRGGRKKAKTCEQKCNKRGKKRGGGKSKGGGKRKKSGQSKAACLAKCNPAATGGGGGGGRGGNNTPGFPIDHAPDAFTVSCDNPGTVDNCGTGSTCFAFVGGTSAGICVSTCTTTDSPTTCPTGTGCVQVVGGAAGAGVCLPTDLGIGCSTGTTCSSGSCVAQICTFCDTARICGTGADAECCVADAECDLATSCFFPTD